MHIAYNVWALLAATKATAAPDVKSDLIFEITDSNCILQAINRPPKHESSRRLSKAVSLSLLMNWTWKEAISAWLIRISHLNPLICEESTDVFASIDDDDDDPPSLLLRGNRCETEINHNDSCSSCLLCIHAWLLPLPPSLRVLRLLWLLAYRKNPIVRRDIVWFPLPSKPNVLLPVAIGAGMK